MAPYKTHCKHGHARTPANTDKRGACRVCVRLRQAALYAREYKAETPHAHRVTGPRT